MSAPLRLALFDCDGTLVDSQALIVTSMQAAFQANGLSAVDPMAVRQVVGLSLGEAITTLAPNQSTAAHQRMVQTYREAYFTNRANPDLQEPLYDGIVDVLEALQKSGVLLGVATGKSKRGLLDLLDRFGLKKYFITLQTPDDNPSKPSPDMVYSALDETGVEIQNTVVIGDTAFDMQMAVNAGAHPLGVAWGYHSVSELRRQGAAEVVTEVSNLPAAFFARF